MTDKAASLFPATSLIRHISLAKLLPFFRKGNIQDSLSPQLGSSVFSLPDYSAHFVAEDDICPLVEAEVFMLFGRKSDAEKALASGLKSGRITARAYLRFWSEQAAKRA
ncbi:hypothetical protein [Dechloromonas sp. HYN0024]|uniref:hypothetical protein n=1 Tax=Dechloromonas sp. HYN0024 TaxID=2231055 RepID=UPI000E44FB1A|nr:hypothetical protein [Dechloromonas sp. HYN0024]AXS79964.1 hypothetical protein HYN24_07980 [Dechloromonas sp. HYN0024]